MDELLTGRRSHSGGESEERSTWINGSEYPVRMRAMDHPSIAQIGHAQECLYVIYHSGKSVRFVGASAGSFQELKKSDTPAGVISTLIGRFQLEEL